MRAELRLIEHIQAFMMHYAARLQDVTTHDLETMLVRCWLHDEWFNYVLPFSTIPVSQTKDIVARFHGIPHCWWIPSRAMSEMDISTIQQFGGYLWSRKVLMSCALASVKVTSVNRTISIKRVTDRQGLRDFAAVYPEKSAVFEAFLLAKPEMILADPQLELYVGRINQQPVVRGAIYGCELAGFHWLYTHPEHRGCGYAHAMQQFRVERAKQLGYLHAGMMSSAAAQSMNHQLGFSPCGTMHALLYRS